MSWISVDVDLDDIWNGMSRSDKIDMSERLYDDGVLGSHTNPEIRRLVRGDDESHGESELRSDLSKIWDSYYQLSNEDCEIIKQITNKL